MNEHPEPSTEVQMWRQLYAKSAERWAAVLDHYGLAEDATSDDVIRAGVNHPSSQEMLEHERALVALGRRLAQTPPGLLDYAMLGKEIAAVVNGLPVVREFLRNNP